MPTGRNDFVGLPVESLIRELTFGKTNQVVQIDCDKEEYSTHPLPSDTRLWIFDTGIKHDLVDSHYGTRHSTHGGFKNSNFRIQKFKHLQNAKVKFL